MQFLKLLGYINPKIFDPRIDEERSRVRDEISKLLLDFYHSSVIDPRSEEEQSRLKQATSETLPILEEAKLDSKLMEECRQPIELIDRYGLLSDISTEELIKQGRGDNELGNGPNRTTSAGN